MRRSSTFLHCCADWGSVTTDDATQNAALAAILFLAGGVGKDSPHCIVTLVGSDPTVRPLVLNRKQAADMLVRQSQHIMQEKVGTAASQQKLLLMLQACLGQLVHANQVTMAHIHLALCHLHRPAEQAFRQGGLQAIQLQAACCAC